MVDKISGKPVEIHEIIFEQFMIVHLPYQTGGNVIQFEKICDMGVYTMIWLVFVGPSWLFRRFLFPSTMSTILHESNIVMEIPLVFPVKKSPNLLYFHFLSEIVQITHRINYQIKGIYFRVSQWSCFPSTQWPSSLSKASWKGRDELPESKSQISAEVDTKNGCGPRWPKFLSSTFFEVYSTLCSSNHAA